MLHVLAQQAGTDTFGQFSQFAAWAAALVVVFGPVARGVTWAVDRVRDFLGTKGVDPSLRWLWPTLALVISLVFCLVFEVNLIASAFNALPRFTTSTALNGVWGQVVTAIGIAGLASSWHDRDKAKVDRALTVRNP